MSKYITRTLKLFAIHMVENYEDPIDYVAFFEKLKSLPQAERFAFTIQHKVVSFSSIEEVGEGVIAIRFINEIDSPYASFFNPENKKETAYQVKGSFPASTAWVFVNPLERFVVIESKRPGVPRASIERYLQLAAVELGYTHPSASLDIVATGKFLEEVMKLEIIKKVELDMHRPNPSWVHGASTVIAQLADDSSASTASVSFKAASGQSLNKNKGIVQDMKVIVSSKHPSAQNVRVTGVAKKGDADVNLNMEKFQVQEALKYDKTKENEMKVLSNRAKSIISRITSVLHPKHNPKNRDNHDSSTGN